MKTQKEKTNKDYGLEYHLQKPTQTENHYFHLHQKYSEEEIIDKMIMFNYSNEIFAIFAGNEEYIKQHHPELLTKNSSFKDKRTPMQYNQDIPAGWLNEDDLKYNINQSENLRIFSNGADKKRTLLIESEITGESDFIVYHLKSRKNIKIEYVSDLSGYVSRNNATDLRCYKYENILKDKALLLIYCETIDKYFLLDLNSDNKIFVSEPKYHTGWHKYVREIKFPHVQLFTYNEIITYLTNYLS